MRWILDDMVFGDIARVVPPGAVSGWPNGELLLADATARAATLDDSGRRQAVLAATSSGTGAPIITSFTINVLGPAGTILYTHLRTGTGGTANLAEHESIAWALIDPLADSVLVTQDKLAAMLALAELGRGRVCHPYELWAHLLAQNYVTRQQFVDLMQATGRRDRSIPERPWRLRHL